jgi:outer membrane protein TolC
VNVLLLALASASAETPSADPGDRVSSGAPASTEGTPTLGFQETLTLVLERNPDRTSARLAEEIAAIGARRARLDRFTATVSATAGADAGFVKPWGEAPQGASDATWDTRARLGVPLYAGGSIQASVDAADASAGIARVDREITERALQRAAYTAYWNIKGYELQIAAAQEGLTLTQQALDIIVAKANAGLAAGIDVNRSKVDLYAQQESLLEQQAALYQADQELLRLLHLPGDRVVLTDDPPASPTETAAPITLAPDAGAGRPELARTGLEAAQARAGVRTARSGVLPTVALSATAGAGATAGGTAAFDAADLRPAVDASVGVQLTWNPFDLLQTRDRVAQANLAAQQVDASTEAEKASIATELRQAASTLGELQQRAPLVDAQVALARDNLQIVQDLYAQGSATILELFDAQASFRAARTQGATLRVDLVIAAYELRWLSGEDVTAPGAPR